MRVGGVAGMALGRNVTPDVMLAQAGILDRLLEDMQTFPTLEPDQVRPANHQYPQVRLVSIRKLALRRSLL